MPFDENESQAENAIAYVAVIYCTFCGHRSMHSVDGGDATMTWRLTPREIRTMRRELPKLRCVFCQEPIDIRVLQRDGESPIS